MRLEEAALNESAAVAAPVAAPVAVAFGDCAGAAEGDAPAAAADADDAGAPEDRDEADAFSAEADKDGLAEQPATAKTAKTAQAVATFTLLRRAMAAAGAHGYRADVGQRRSRDVEPLRPLRLSGDTAVAAQTRACIGSRARSPPFGNRQQARGGHLHAIEEPGHRRPVPRCDRQ